ncbi:unnamed protein product [Vitrella brassicaformis CCMP3155]|uniref:Mitochondrial carrier protein n=1 Tax=Vitrella brassicaformis (strain CCMP3155) TaxID=1169540 RepID=A0A0G4ETE1_VITBC|nr:unnamed protein product [Vitrella brassicaformis CCMP3155]|eukprot:CEM01713.1 unnamed protein product [Vitrella brassicaformis CCMP3155]
MSNPREEVQKLKWQAAAISGACAGIVGSVLLQPLDLIKTRQQQPNKAPEETRFLRVAAQTLKANGLRGLWRGVVPTVFRVGPGAALYFTCLHLLQTNCPAKWRQKPREGVHIGDYFKSTFKKKEERRKEALGKKDQNGLSEGLGVKGGCPHAPTPPPAIERSTTERRRDPSEGTPASWYNLLAGATSRTFSATVLSPVAVVKTRMESTVAYGEQAAARAKGVTMRGVFLYIWRHEGVLGFYRGLLPTLARDVPYSSIYYMVYQKIKHTIGLNNKHEKGYVVKNFACSASAGAFAAFVTHPPDIVRTRLQLQMAMQPPSPSPSPAPSPPPMAAPAAAAAAAAAGVPAAAPAGQPACVHVFGGRVKLGRALSEAYRIVMQEGVWALFRGIESRLLKRTLAAALTWTIFDEISKFANKCVTIGSTIPYTVTKAPSPAPIVSADGPLSLAKDKS